MEIVSLDDLRIISDTDPFEPDYTGNNLIVEKDGKYGIIRPQAISPPTTYCWKVFPKETHIKHWSFLTRADETIHVFILRNEKGKLAILLDDKHYKGGHRFEEISYLEQSPSTALIKENGHYGYLNLAINTVEYHIEPVFLKQDNTAIDWFSLDWLCGDIKLQNNQGKWAVYSANLELMVNFVLDAEPEYTRFGTYQYNGDTLNKNIFFKRYGI